MLLLLLPLFPLRKRPRLPTESLQLNLFEPRYLALARRANETGQFAAVYCGSTPSILVGGTGPATPLVKPGSVGVVCSVDDAQGSEVIRLQATVQRRCVINEVSRDLPYILADVDLLDDKDHLLSFRKLSAIPLKSRQRQKALESTDSHARFLRFSGLRLFQRDS